MKKKIPYLALAFACALSTMFSFGTNAHAANVEDTIISSDELQDTSTKEDSCLVNVSVGSSYTITLPKKITLSGDDGTGSYNVTVKGNIGARQRVSVVPDETFNLKSSGKEDVVTTVTQPKKVFKFDEVSVLDGESNLIGTTTNGTVNAGKLTKGRWSGTFTFNVDSYEYSQIGVEAEDGEGNDLNAEAFTIEGQEKEDLLDALVDSELVPDVTSADDIDALIEVNSDDFDDLADTTFDVSSIAGEGDKVVILHYNEETKEWEYIGTDTVEDGKVSADFESYSPVAFIVVKDDGTLHSHNYILESDTSTCTGDGVKTYSCECSDFYTEGSTKKGHVDENEDSICEICGTGFRYESFTITKSNCYKAGITTDGSVIIPSTFVYEGKNYKVTNIDNYAFESCTKITSIVIPDSVTSIGAGAFSGCKNLINIDLGGGVTSIGKESFSNCSNINSIIIPDNVTTIKDRAFSNCENLENVYIGYGANSIAPDILSVCSNLESIVVDSKNDTYDSRNNCNAIIKTEDNQLIRGCLNTIIPDSVTSIGNSAFGNCSKLESIDIPTSVISIGDYAFESCTKITSIVIPNSVTTIGDSAFAACGTLESIVIPDSVTSFGTGVFYSCASLTNVTLGNGITSIGSSTFYKCEKLVSVNIPRSITFIGIRAFYYCSSLKEIVIPDGITKISDQAFYATKIKSIVIPDSVESIGREAFSSINHVTYNGPATGSPWGANYVNGYIEDYIVYSDNSKTVLNTYVGFDNNITIPNSVTAINNYAFAGRNNLVSIIIPDSVESIGKNAFYNCTNLSNVNIPDSVTSISSGAFKNVPHITYNGPATGKPWGAKSIN